MPLFPPRKLYRVIVADPPWTFGDKLEMSEVKRGADAQYGGRTLSTADLCDLPVGKIADDDAVLVLWFPDSLLADALRVAGAWSFRQTQVWTWVKTGKDERRLDPEAVPNDLAMGFGMGRIARNCCEHALVGVRGSPYKHLRDRATRNVFLHLALPHSTKPETVQDALDRMFPDGHRLELFARRQRFGTLPWSCWGDEAPATKGLDIRAVLAGALEQRDS